MNLLNLGLNILAGNVVALIMNNGDVKRGEFLGVMPDDMIVLCSESAGGIIALCEIQREDVRWIYRF